MKIKLLEQQDGRAVFDLDNGYNVIEEACRQHGLAVTSNRSNMERNLVRKMVDDFISRLIKQEGVSILENN